MEHRSDIYYLILDKIKSTHDFFGTQNGDKYDLYKKKLDVLCEIEDYTEKKLGLRELFEITEILRVAKTNCQLKINHYYQIERQEV